MSRRCALVGILLLAACDPVSIPERSTDEIYDFRLVTGADSVVMRWPNGSRIRLFVQPSDTARDRVLIESVEQGIGAWQLASLFENYRLERAAAAENADVIVAWSDAQLPVDVSQCMPAGGRAFTTFCLTGNEKRLAAFPLRNGSDSQIRFIVTVSAAEAGNPASARRLVAHELGHVLGIAQHSANTDDLMFTDPRRDSPSVRDRATIQVLYQTRAGIWP